MTSCFGSLRKKKSKQDKADATSSKNDSAPFLPNRDSVIPVKENKIIISRPTDVDTYNSNNDKVGIALIFNHKNIKGQKERTGTEKDRDSLKQTWQSYGFDVRVYNDLTFEEVTDVLKKTAKEDHSENDCFVLVTLSHGGEGKVYASDMSFPVERLWNPFLGDNCKTLVNKPKLFFIQACRGEKLEKPVVFDEFVVMSREVNAAPEAPTVVTYAIPSTADMLVMYSTFEKFYSFRNVENGSWFIQCLCAVLDEATQDPATTEEGAEILRLLTAVNRKVAYEYQSNSKNDALNQMKEMPNFLSTLTKTFYLRVKRLQQQQQSPPPQQTTPLAT